MADSILFNGTTDAIAYDIGSSAFAPGDLTIAVICKQTADDAIVEYLAYWGVSIAGADRYALYHATSGALGLQIGNNIIEAPTATFHHSQQWTLAAVTHAAGTTTPRFHTYDYNTTTWVHEDAGGTIADGTAPATVLLHGRYIGTSDYWNGSILIVGVWNSVLNDAQIEALIPNLPAWQAAAPAAGWRLDTLSAIVPFAGTGTESSRVGTTLDTGDVPPGWSDTAVSGLAWIRA